MGTYCKFTNQGGLVHPGVSVEDLDELSSLLQVRARHGALAERRELRAAAGVTPSVRSETAGRALQALSAGAPRQRRQARRSAARPTPRPRRPRAGPARRRDGEQGQRRHLRGALRERLVGLLRARHYSHGAPGAREPDRPPVLFPSRPFLARVCCGRSFLIEGAGDAQVIESIFKLREQQPAAIANEMRNALIDTFA